MRTGDSCVPIEGPDHCHWDRKQEEIYNFTISAETEGERGNILMGALVPN